MNYADKPKLAPLVQEIAWAHNIAIMEKCKGDLPPEFYLRMAKKFGWTKNVLIHQIETIKIHLTNNIKLVIFSIAFEISLIF